MVAPLCRSTVLFFWFGGGDSRDGLLAVCRNVRPALNAESATIRAILCPLSGSGQISAANKLFNQCLNCVEGTLHHQIR